MVEQSSEALALEVVRLAHLPKPHDRGRVKSGGLTQWAASSSAVIADITQLNENVMYEVGYAHGRGLMPLIYTRDAARRDHLPVYFRTLNVHVASDERQLGSLIDGYLQSVKVARRASRS